MLSPGETVIGILGGGQLGRMIALAAAQFGYTCHIWCQPGEESPASQVAAYTLCAPYDDEDVLSSFARSCHLATVEFENVPAATLAALAEQGLPVYPRADVLAMLLKIASLRNGYSNP